MLRSGMMKELPWKFEEAIASLSINEMLDLRKELLGSMALMAERDMQAESAVSYATHWYSNSVLCKHMAEWVYARATVLLYEGTGFSSSYVHACIAIQDGAKDGRFPKYFQTLGSKAIGWEYLKQFYMAVNRRIENV